MKTYVGIDNGVTGSIGWIAPPNAIGSIVRTPVKKVRAHTKQVAYYNRVDHISLCNLFGFIFSFSDEVIFNLEIPFTAPDRAKQSMSAFFAFEATRVCIEQESIKFPIKKYELRYTTAPQWRKKLQLQKGQELDFVKEKFPNVAQLNYKDYDGLLIAYADYAVIP